MKTQEMRILANKCGYESTAELIEAKCPSEFDYIDFGTVENNICKGGYDKLGCTKCWKESTRPEDIEANIMAEENETLILTRKAFDNDEDYAEYLKKLREANTTSIIADDNAAEKQQEQVRHPAHYSQPNRRECIEEMRLMFGDEKVYWWCVMTAYKYRYRMGNKDGNPSEQDEKKAEWYLDYAENMKGRTE